MLRRARLHTEIESAYLSTVTALANALEAKDLQTQEHASATSRLAVAVGRELSLAGSDLRDLEFAAVLHDVGKIAIPDEILSRRGPLSDEEWAFVRDHTVVGERILRGIPFLQSAASAVRSAHERWDGEGYPDGLAGERIPLLSRIVFACDTWDVMTSDRPYREALPATRPSAGWAPRRALSSTRRCLRAARGGRPPRRARPRRSLNGPLGYAPRVDQLVTDAAGVEQIAARARAAGRCAIDTEFFWERTYAPVLCLVQIAVDGDVVLIDPLAGAPLEPSPS